MGSNPILVTKIAPWCNGSVLVLHARGDSSILSGATMMSLKTFKNKVKADFKTWDEWVLFVNENEKYAREHSKVNDYIGKCETHELPSYHPYWRFQTISKMEDNIITIKRNIESIKKNPSMMRYIYNRSTRLEDLYKKIKDIENKILNY